MKKIFVFLGTFFLFINPIFTVEENILKNVNFDNGVLKIETNVQVKYNVFKIGNPPRLIIDLYDTVFSEHKKEISINSDILKRIRIAMFQEKPTKISRIVLDLEKNVVYEHKQIDNNINIILSKRDLKNVGNEIKISTTNIISETEKIVKESEKKVKPKKEKKELVKEEKLTIPKKEEKKEKEVISKTEASLPIEKSKQVKVTEEQEKKISEKKVEKETYTQKEKTTTSSSTKSSLKTQEKKEFGVVLPKTKTTLELQDADIRDVLQLISIRSGVNIIYGADVTGEVTISLRDVPIDQAFKTILSLKGLTYIPVAENVLRVITPTQLTTERSQAVTFTKIFPLNYANAEEVKAQLDSIRGIEGRKGITNVDKRTNSIIITDTQEGLEFCEKFIKELDVKPMQVMIEAKIVDFSVDDLRELGVNWSHESLTTQPGTGKLSHDKTYPVGPVELQRTIDQSGVGRVEARGAESSLGVPTGGLFSFGWITDREVFNMKLGMLVTQGKAKILSNPKVATMNNKEAKIIAGEKFPYKSTTIEAGGRSQENWVYLDAGVQLTVTPTISPDKYITLKVKPVVSIPAPATAQGVPPQVKTRETEVTIMVRDNDTLVIGGLITENDLAQIRKIPLLGDLPILGYLFKYKSNTKTTTELVVFITPKIIED